MYILKKTDNYVWSEMCHVTKEKRFSSSYLFGKQHLIEFQKNIRSLTRWPSRPSRREAQRDGPGQGVLPLPPRPRCVCQTVSSHQRSPLHGHRTPDCNQIGPKEGAALWGTAETRGWLLTLHRIHRSTLWADVFRRLVCFPALCVSGGLSWSPKLLYAHIWVFYTLMFLIETLTFDWESLRKYHPRTFFTNWYLNGIFTIFVRQCIFPFGS